MSLALPAIRHTLGVSQSAVWFAAWRRIGCRK
jgi:hypothetical protein